VTTADLVSFVVVDYNAGDALATCLRSIAASWRGAIEIIVIRNGEPTRVDPLDVDAVEISIGKNLGFAAGANLGIGLTRGAWIALVNPDAIVPENGVSQLIDFLQARPSAAAVSPILRTSHGVPQPYWYGRDPSPLVLLERAIRRFTRQNTDWAMDRPRQVDWISGACLVARRAAFDAVGRFDERFFMYFEDADWCRRCRQAGWEIWTDPAVSVTHLSWPDPADRKRRALYRESLRGYYRRWYGPLAGIVLDVLAALGR
jgi:GT2 family glycosyltransferase